MLKKYKVLILLFLIFASYTMVKQLLAKSENVIVRKGNLPLIITAPHGGLRKPKHIPDRVRNGSLLLADMYTQDIAEGLEQYIQTYHRDAKPYIVLNQISRRKADMNRSLKEGTETELGEQVWIEYHNHVEDCIRQVLSQFSHGIIIDIHGHTHTDNMVELGYLLRPEELQFNDLIREKSSIKSLVSKSYLEPQEAIHLLGNLMTNPKLLVTPSSHIPVPKNALYFSGGFTTQNYYNDKVDVIQVEIPKSMRHDKENRTHFINTLGDSLIKLLDEHYTVKLSKL